MAISYDKIGDLYATFYGNVKVGDVVTISSSNTVAKASDGQTFAGVCVDTDGKLCTVQVKGFMNLKCSPSALGVGKQVIVCAGNNEIKAGNPSTNGRSGFSVASDSPSKEIVVLI